MMGEKLSWRRIEFVLEDIARANGYAIEEDDLGDKIAIIEYDGVKPVTIGLTELAKELEERLA